jgi:cGMP-dependent protein kinase
MGCSVLCKVTKENEVIKSEVNKDFLENNEPNTDNIENVLTRKEMVNDKKVEMNNEPKQIFLSINKGNNNPEKSNNIVNQTPKTNNNQKLTNFTSKIQGIHEIKEGISPEDEKMLKKTFKAHFLFNNKSNEIISSIISQLKLKIFEKDYILFKAGNEGTEFYIIKKGKILINTEYGDKYLKEWETFGELALIQNGKRTATAIAIERCELFVLNGVTFREMLKKINETDLNEKIDSLKSNALFSLSGNNKLKALSNIMIKCTFKGGETIVYKNDLGDSIYIIRVGEVQCLDYDEENNKVKKIRHLKPKDYFGEASVLFDVKRTLSIKVLEPYMECYQISKYNLESILGHDYRQIIISSICKMAFAKSKYLKHFVNPTYFKKIMEKGKMKDFEDKEVVISCENLTSKFYVVLMGNLIEENTDLIVCTRGELYVDPMIRSGNLPKRNIIAGFNLKVVEFDLNEIVISLGIKIKNKNNNYKIFKIFEDVDNLRKISLFKETPSHKLVDIVMKMTMKTYKENDVIFEEGEIGDKLYMIKSGRVRVYSKNKYMRELGEGSCFGEVALLLDEPRTATIIAACDCKICYLTKEAFNSLVDENMLNYLHDKIYLEEGYNLSLEDFYYAKGLGHGKFGNVSLVHNMRHFFAIKAVSRKAAEKQKILIKYFIQERNILLTLEHPFIMKLLKTFKTKNNIFFLLEYIKGRGMNKYLNNRIKLSNEKETIFYIANILLALDYLNSRQVCHRDLKPDNIIIDEKGYLKIIDFGTSIIIDKNYTNTVTGTPHYMAPEILLGQGYGFSCDYWSLGIIAYETYYGNYPFGRNAKDPIDVYKEVIRKEVIYNGGENSIIQLIGGLLTKNETDRICSLEKAKQYEALKNFEWEDLKEFKIKPQYIPKKVVLKSYEEYNVKYLQYLRQQESKNQDSEDLLSSYDEKALSFKYDENWADIF